MNFKKLFFVTGVLLFSNSLFCFESISTMELLLSYLENDTDLQKNAMDVQKAQLSLDSTEIKNGFDITLSTGTITINANQNGTGITVKPSVQASLPQTSNMKISASSNIDIRTEKQSFNDNSLNVSVDIISTNSLSRKISLLKAERSLAEANRKLKNQAITSEKAFYTELKNLLSSTKTLINTSQTFYTNSIDFEKIKAQGYSEKSSTYRLAQMKVLSGQHEIENMNRSLIHSFVLFYKKCGIELNIDEQTKFEELIPSDITEPEILDIHSFEPDSYSEVEAALWTNKINSMERQTNKSFSLGANGGLTFNNSTTNTHTVDAGVSSTIGGVNLNAGVNIPLSTQATPAFTLAATISPNTFKQNQITLKTQEVEEQRELLDIQIARSNYETKLVDMEQSLSDLKWTIQNDNESYEMYAQLEKDLGNWYKQGIITQSEYLSARNYAEAYAVKKIMNILDLIIYNDTVQTMFVENTQE